MSRAAGLVDPDASDNLGALCKSMFRNENCKIRAKIVKREESVSGTDTPTSAEQFASMSALARAAEFCNLQ